ncbi:MAG: methyl-accepting chemotaxis protein [Oscillospiraceae bacterium]|nr:methyl-accepting chemotaxis protein [Oscillospiraceae bacterium]
MKSIGIKITVIMLCVTFIGISVTVGIATFIAGSSLIDETLEKTSYQAKYESVVLDEWFMFHKATSKALAVSVSQIEELDKAHVFALLAANINSNADYQDVYIGFPDDTAIMGSGFDIESEYYWWKATEREWYRKAIADTTQPAVTSLYVDVATGDLCITVSHALVKDGVLRGVIGIDILVNVLQDMVFSAEVGESAYMMLLDTDGRILIHPEADYAPSGDDFKYMQSMMGSHYAGLWSSIAAKDGNYKHNDGQGIPKYYSSNTLNSTGWHIVVVTPTSVINQPIVNVLLVVIPITIVLVAISALIIYTVIQRNVKKPLAPVVGYFNRASSTGEMALTSEDAVALEAYSHSANEIGQMIKAVKAFASRITEVSELMKAVAEGNLTDRVSLLSDKDEMGSSLATMIENLNSMFHEIIASTDQVSSSARQIAETSSSIASGASQMAEGAQSLSEGAVKQTEYIQDLSASIANIAENTRQNVAMTDRAAKLADSIINKAEVGSRQMAEMVAAVNEITEASISVSNIMETINGIAEQTNLLSLNAAIEAVRAGEHGSGFSVVAGEVRDLATQSAEAAKKTNSIIQVSIEKAELGTRIVNEMSVSLNEIIKGIKESSRLNMEIAKASEDQSEGVTRIRSNVSQVSDVIQSNSAVAEENAATSEESAAAAQESSAASQEMSSQADLLKALTTKFRLRGGS